MATAKAALPLPILPTGWSAENNFKVLDKLSTPENRDVEPVGQHFLAYAHRKRFKRTFSEHERVKAAEKVSQKQNDEEESGEISEPEDPLMLQRSAKDWKNQDHYAVLGLSKYRFRATEEQIKKAHRKKVLKHHPDKKAAAGAAEDDSFFKCIQKANEILTDPNKRRQFDSVDAGADVHPPPRGKNAPTGANFYKQWAPVFAAEARFSNIKPVPELGNDDSSKEKVDTFYNFFYNFNSWRSFEYQDEDVPDDNESRDQRRHIERKNTNSRKKKKSEDIARLRKLVDECLEADARIARFRKQEKAHKNKKRDDKAAAERKAAEEEAVRKEAELRERAEREAQEKIAKEEAKKTNAANKNAAKKNKRVIRTSVKDDANFFVEAGATATPAQIDRALNDSDAIINALDYDGIAAFAAKLTGLKDSAKIKEVFVNEYKTLKSSGALKDQLKSLE